MKDCNKYKRIIYISLGATFFFLLLIAARLVFRYVMESQGVYLRTWVEITIKVVVALGLPTSLFVWVLAQIIHAKKNLTLAIVASSLLYAFVIFIASIYVFLSILWMEQEEKSDTGFLVGRMDEFYTYYVDYTWLTKKPYLPTVERILYEMRKRYDIEMVESPQNESDIGVHDYIIESVEPLPITFHVFSDRYVNFEDDYVQVRANTIMRKIAGELGAERTLADVVSRDYLKKNIVEALDIPCYGREDAEECSKLVAALMGEVGKDSACQKEGINITVGCVGTNGDVKPVTFRVRGAAFEEYSDWLNVYDEIWSFYRQEEANTIAEQEVIEPVIQIDYESSPIYVEGAYKVLYEELFASLDYPYVTSYNAKGNFYAPLTEGTGTLESREGTFKTEEKVVYDRQSKNGKCHLFVHYRDYFEEGENTSFTTGIVNMYAVDMETGNVYKSDRHAWADLGTKEYRDATGE